MNMHRMSSLAALLSDGVDSSTVGTLGTCGVGPQLIRSRRRRRTANEGPVRIQYKCLVHIYVFPAMKLLFPKQNYNVVSPSSYTHVSMRDLYIPTIDLPFLLQ